MSKRKDKSPAAPDATPLSGSRLALAYELARHGIAQLLPDRAIVLSITEQCKTTERSAASALQKMAKQGAKLSKDDALHLRETIDFRLEHLYARAAQDGKLEQAAKMLDRRARLAGLFQKETQSPLSAEEADEFAGRSSEDLRHYAEHGYFPEERPPANVVPIDPLARLRKKA